MWSSLLRGQTFPLVDTWQSWKSSFTLTWNLFFQFLGLKGNLKLANFSIIILQLRNLKLERIKPLFYPWVVCQHQKQKWTSLLCPIPDNPEDILKHYCVPPTRQWECSSYLNLHYLSLLPVDKVSPVHVSFTAWPHPWWPKCHMTSRSH